GIIASRVAARRAASGAAQGAIVQAHLVATAAFQASVITATGGVDSPLLPGMIPLALLGGALAGSAQRSLSVVGLQVSVVVSLTVIQAAGIDALVVPALGRGRTAVGTCLAGAAMALILSAVTTAGVRIRARLEAVIERALVAREGELSTWVDRSRELESIGGEIAHELKNPLASIKGLAALVARDLPAGKAAERLGVLRAEVDRMQAILEGFLNYTRPLSPLELGEVDLVAAARHVASMHEGERVEVVVDGYARPIRGDRRKLLQVLVNLVQNALDASPVGGRVTLHLRDAGAEQLVEVVDQGPGPSPDLADRLFEPGVTAKPDGSGLGLPIARALARRHGGDVELTREPRGTVARLRLPIAGPAHREAA
ncbi:MAG TPA: HAMP domain-containing sensor histidine kinase, partial [Myxococcota bacterium]|nr:HAMP domain-containing sensor histidine kinase [Myxococcota bacterium]